MNVAYHTDCMSYMHEGIIIRLLKAFPGSFINSRFEFIAHQFSNSYFILTGCADEDEVRCKMLEWLSRPAHKSQPYHSEAANKKFHLFMLAGINEFLHTKFTEEDMAMIYQRLGNAVRHDLTVEFVKSGFDMNLLKGGVD